jgi:hypothetical protein
MKLRISNWINAEELDVESWMSGRDHVDFASSHITQVTPFPHS